VVRIRYAEKLLIATCSCHHSRMMTLILSSSSRTARDSDSAVRRWRGASRGRSTLGAVVAMGIIGLTTGCQSQSASQSLSQGESQSQSQSSLPVQTPIPALSPIPVQSPISVQSPNPIQSPSPIQSLTQSLTQSLAQSLSPSANSPTRSNAPNGLALAVRTNQDAIQTISLSEPSSAVNQPSATAAQVTPTAPGPLPALGLATAFGYSHRLRKRIKKRGNSHRSLQ